MAIIGAHVSVAGGLYKGVENAEHIGAECIQIFGSSPRQWSVKMPTDADIKKYKDALKKSSIKAVYLHAPYLVNLASSNDDMRDKSIMSLSGHLQIAEMIGADGVIFHVGSGGSDITKEEALKKSIAGIKAVLDNVPGKSYLIVENTAGGGHKVGANIDEIAKILKAVRSNRLKICIDTAHAYEAGLIKEYTGTNIKKLIDEIDKKIGIKNIATLHVNDSKTAYNSHHDRHENIGEGFIGIEGFKNLAKARCISDLPWILEVPGFKNEGPDRKNIDILKNVLK